MARQRAPTPGYQPIAGDKARRYVDINTGEIVSRRTAEGLTLRGRIDRFGWHVLRYKTLAGVDRAARRVPSGHKLFISAHGAGAPDTGSPPRADETGTYWRSVIPVTMSDEYQGVPNSREEVEERTAEYFILSSIDAWTLRWK